MATLGGLAARLSRLARRAIEVLRDQGVPRGAATITRGAARRVRSRWQRARQALPLPLGVASALPPIDFEAEWFHAEAEARERAVSLYRHELAAFTDRPLLSIVMPTYNTPLPLLKKAIVSVEKQLYANWELCIVDDCSTDPRVRRFLQVAAAANPKIKLHCRTVNGHISAATNDGLDRATGDFVAFLDHDDELTADGLFHVVRLLNDKPATDVIYSDQDKIDLANKRSEPFFKPDWSPEYFRGVMYLGHLLVVRRSLLLAVGGCDARFNNIQDYELALRLTEQTARIEHIPRILYHWRRTPGSIAGHVAAKANIDALQEQAVQEHLDRLQVVAHASRLGGHRVRVGPGTRSSWPMVSILIPTRDRPELIGRCLESLYATTSYKAFEVVVGDNETSDPEALAILRKFPVRHLPLPGAFHFSRFNNRMAEVAQGDYLLLLNNDTEVLYPDWLDHLLLYAEKPDVGAVGPLLLYPDGKVQHAGVILGPRGTADHVLRGFEGAEDGYAGSLRCTREVSAVTGGCLMVRKEKYLEAGGLNEHFVRHYEDVDFCLRLRARGYRNLYVASTALLHHESKTRGNSYSLTDRVLLLDYWEPEIVRGDPFYNRNFDANRYDYSLRIQGVGA